MQQIKMFYNTTDGMITSLINDFISNNRETKIPSYNRVVSINNIETVDTKTSILYYDDGIKEE